MSEQEKKTCKTLSLDNIIQCFKTLKFEMKLELKLELKWFEASERNLELKWSVE